MTSAFTKLLLNVNNGNRGVGDPPAGIFDDVNKALSSPAALELLTSTWQLFRGDSFAGLNAFYTKLAEFFRSLNFDPWAEKRDQTIACSC